MQHLTQRVAWHDRRWNGHICAAPSANAFCVLLDEVRKNRQDELEDSIAGQGWGVLSSNQLPPCSTQAGGFMNAEEWRRVVQHPYQANRNTQPTHGHLRPTPVPVGPYTFFAVPFWWMLTENRDAVERQVGTLLAADEKAPFPTPWVFGRERQREINDGFFSRLTPNRSLVFFYTKEGHPLGEGIPRAIVGVGTVTSVGRRLEYDTDGSKPSYPMWDRLVRHSIRPNGAEGFLLPYHDYLDPTGDPEEDARRRELLSEVIVQPESEDIREFSYMSELAAPDTALSALLRCLEAVRAVLRHGIAAGPWLEREEWLNAQLAATWEDRGGFPGLGSALEALGMRMGTALTFDLLRRGAIQPDLDPWPAMDALLRGQSEAPAAYKHDLAAVRDTWLALPPDRVALLHLLSRFALAPEQAARWFAPEKRRAAGVTVADSEILANPYCIAELDPGGRDSTVVSMGSIDRGVLPQSPAASRHPLPEPSFVGSPRDPRRARGALVSLLRGAAEDGDALMLVEEVLGRLPGMRLAPELDITSDWIHGNKAVLERMIDVVEVRPPGATAPLLALQLSTLKEREEYLRKVLPARARRRLASLQVDWQQYLQASISETGSATLNPQAVATQAEALERITTRKLSVLVGQAGTGKTSTLGALLRCPALSTGGILLLAPTGKARVRMGRSSGHEANTVAQFLYSQGMYDPVRQRPRFECKEPYKGARTVVVDECSMLTMDDLVAVLRALDLAHVERIILAGDPNQLPPIGVGRPFADLVGYLENASADDLSGAVGRLRDEVRTKEGARSDTLRLAAWFMGGAQPPGADKIMADLESGASFNDLSIGYWQTPTELRGRLLDAMREHIRVDGIDDIVGFDRALGLDDRSWADFEKPNGAENFQVLSPVRLHEHGVVALNRWFQRTFRGERITLARRYGKPLLGDEEITRTDKVIQVRNELRDGWSPSTGARKQYIANGEVGVAVADNKGFLNILFADRPGETFGYRSGADFSGGSGPLELAYALTVHKAQGSDFDTVFVVIPERARVIRRELLYTALTRSRERLVLLVQGKDPGWVFDLSRATMSETLRRNTNLFAAAVRLALDELPYAEHLVHRADDGTMVRSKSELVIANKLYAMNLPYRYEEFFIGSDGTRVLPDFTFVDAAGERVVWEHLGMMDRPDYRDRWEWKRDWYKRNGLVEGETLFATEEREGTGLDSQVLTAVAEKIRGVVA